MLNLLLGVALVAAPFFIKIGVRTTTNLSQDFFLIITSLALLVLFGASKTHKNFKLMGALLFIAAFVTHNPFGITQAYQWFMCFFGLVFMIVVFANHEHIKLKTIYFSLGAVCIMESLWILLQHYGISLHTEYFKFLYPMGKIETLTGSVIYGSLGNINHSAALIAVTLPFLPLHFLPLPIVALYLGQSAMPVICAMVALTTLYAYRKKNYLPLLIGALGLFISALMLISGAFPEGHFLYGSTRIAAWTKAFETVKFSFFGKGLGWVPEIFSRFSFKGERYMQMHNEWVELYAIGGLLAVVVGVYLILPIFKNKGSPAINACLIALLVNSLGNFTLHIAPLFMVFGTCYALHLAKE